MMVGRVTPNVTLTIENASMPEDDGVATVVATVDRITRLPVTVHLSYGGTARSGVNYTRSSTVIHIPPLATSGSVRLTALADGVPAGNTTVEVSIESVDNGQEVGEQMVTAAIIDNGLDFPFVSLNADPQSTPENTSVKITATLSRVSSRPVNIRLNFGGTATVGADFTATDYRITVPAGSTSGAVTLNIRGDLSYEQDESLYVLAEEAENGLLRQPDNAAMVTITATTPEEYKTTGEIFLVGNSQEPGITVTESGLQYKVLTQGTGPKPTASDTVITRYTGTLLDGTLFDTSGEETRSFQVSGVIPGWQEALQMMPVGSKWTLYIPQNLAYGEQGTSSIPPFAVLFFDVELVGIEGR